MLGNARWLGCRWTICWTRPVFNLAADQIVGWSVDGWSGGFPVEVLDGRDAMVAIGMNGELLNAEHGFPGAANHPRRVRLRVGHEMAGPASS